jgi:eukaryotic-like serine/threonine-protein kinase
MYSPLNPGDQLDHYRIEGLVARGGMACMFRGTDLQTGQPVAIKVPHFELECDPVFFDRFHREAEIGRKFDHPGVVKVLPAADQSRVYMVMEWIEGRLLREILTEREKLPADRAVRIALGICNALAYIHGRGIVHRDLKPENIMVDAEDRIKLLDFGIAAKGGDRRLTFSKLSGSTMGTPDYISPEQVRRNRGDARSDIYAVGVMLYEMLTGRTPFQGDNPFAVMNARLVSTPVPPCEIVPDLPPQLQEIVYRAMERDPRNRYATANEFAWDLEHQDQIGVAGHGKSQGLRLRRSPGRQMLLSYLALASIPIVIFALLLLVARQH